MVLKWRCFEKTGVNSRYFYWRFHFSLTKSTRWENASQPRRFVCLLGEQKGSIFRFSLFFFNCLVSFFPGGTLSLFVVEDVHFFSGYKCVYTVEVEGSKDS